MGKRKVGIYVFTNQKKERLITDRDKYFDGKAYYGINFIISQIENSDISFVSSSSINSVDFVLVSITSHYDILNINHELNNKKITSKIIFGGAGISGIESLYDFAWAICFGRAEGLINKIFECEPLPNVWYKHSDINLTQKYEIGKATKLINIKGYIENSVGCNCLCNFCQYGFKNKYFNPTENTNYNSGYSRKEDTIKNIDFSLCNRATAPHLVSAIDGLTESTRKIINKKILNSDIIQKFTEIYNQKQSYFALKLYNIIGFPWETKIELNEFIDAIHRADKMSEKKLNIFMISTHFVPMPFTPMENEGVNEHDFRKEVEQKKYNYKGQSINLYYPATQITGPSSAFEETVLLRMDFENKEKINTILNTSKYKTLNSVLKIKTIKKYFPEKLYGQNDNILPYIIRPYKTEGIKNKYYKYKALYNVKILP